MIYQSPLTVLAPIIPDRLPALRSILDTINKEVEENEFISFSKLTTIHFCRFVIITPLNENGTSGPAWLAFSTNYDGELDQHLNELYSKAGNGFDQIYSQCENYQASGSAQFVGYMKAHMMPFPNAFYIGHRGLSVETIWKQSKIRKAIQEFLNDQPQDANKPLQIKKNIINHLKLKHPQLMEGEPPAIHLKSLALPILITLVILLAIGFAFSWTLLLWFLLALLGVIGLLYVLLRQKENSDPQIEIKDESELVSNISRLTANEDFTVQNQLTHLVTIKSGWFRLFLLKLVLWGINVLAVREFNKGKLGNIPTIHFARWVIIDKGRRLLFFSNFDGSWESYLGDFVDKAAVGLTAVWSNTDLFPRTKNLAFQGATDEERFKYWTRVHQIPTQVWYSAYKTLSVVNVINNNEIHQGLFAEMNEEAAIKWLRKL